MNELDLIGRLLPHLARSGGELVIGPGQDDAAAWREPGGGFTVASIDTSVEGVHFDLARQRPEDVGWRALCFALGDLAAKGARPTFGLASLSVPPSWGEDVPVAIYSGLGELAARIGLRLAGGDTTAAPAHGSLTLAVLGRTEAAPRPRTDARAGWAIGVTGSLGGAGLHVARPLPQLDAGVRLAAAGLVCGDISDGLVREHDKLQAMTGLGARIELERVPVVPGVDALSALASGEEVELACWGPAPLPAEVIQVGELGPGRVVVVDGAGRELELAERGYDHFA